jgi:hypothetical protein
VTTSTIVDPLRNTTTVIKSVAKDSSSNNSSSNGCGKFPTSGEHPSGANWPVVPVVA